MAEPLTFNTDNCSLPSLPAPDFNFIEDCEIPPAPPPATDCPDLDLAADMRPVPPDVMPDCPDIDGHATLTVQEGVPPQVILTVIPGDNNGDGECFYLFDFQFILPAGGGGGGGGGESASSESSSASISYGPPPSESLLSLSEPSVAVDCPCIEATASGDDCITATVGVTRTDREDCCEFMFDFHFAFNPDCCSCTGDGDLPPLIYDPPSDTAYRMPEGQIVINEFGNVLGVYACGTTWYSPHGFPDPLLMVPPDFCSDSAS